MGVGPTDRVFRFLWHNRVLGTGFGVVNGPWGMRRGLGCINICCLVLFCNDGSIVWRNEIQTMGHFVEGFDFLSLECPFMLGRGRLLRKRRCFNKEIGPINVYVRVLARSRRKIVLHQSWRVRIEKLVMRGRLWEIMRFLRSVLWMRGRLWILSRWKRCCSEAINFGRRQWASLCGLNRRKQSQ
ncbi:hypothetical protein V6N13_115935 [Hibiscus sabdariffa]